MEKLKILLLGLTGGTGGAFATVALAAGHRVTALARSPEAVQMTHQNLEVLRGDSTSAAQLVAHAGDCDVIVSTVGVRGFRASTKPTTLYRETGYALREAAGALRGGAGGRVVAVSSGGLERQGTPGEFPAFYLYLMRPMLMETYLDQARMEEILLALPTPVTLWRPGWLFDGPPDPRAVVVDRFMPPGRSRTARGSLAQAMLDRLVSDPSHRQIWAIGQP